MSCYVVSLRINKGGQLNLEKFVKSQNQRWNGAESGKYLRSCLALFHSEVCRIFIQRELESNVAGPLLPVLGVCGGGVTAKCSPPYTSYVDPWELAGAWADHICSQNMSAGREFLPWTGPHSHPTLLRP